MAFQPFLGLMHHRHFVRHQGRGFVSHWHIWWGRLLMVLGVVNGGLGLHLSFASKAAIIGYSVASAVIFIAYVAAKVFASRVLAPARSEKNVVRGVSVSGNGQVYNKGSRRRRDAPDMAYGYAGDYSGGQSESGRHMQQQEQQHQRAKGREMEMDSVTYLSTGGSSASPSLPPTRGS